MTDDWIDDDDTFYDTEEWPKERLLPAVIHVFDHEIDLEERANAKLEVLYRQLNQRLQDINQRVEHACLDLENDPSLAQLSSSLAGLRLRLARLRAQILQAQAKSYSEDRPPEQLPEHAELPEPTTDTPLESVEEVEEVESLSKNKLHEREAAKALLRFKKASKRVREVHRKIVMLTHESRVGKNKHFRELYDLANAARLNNDLNALLGILDLVKRYNSSQGRLATINYLKQNKRVLSAEVSRLKTKIQDAQKTKAYRVWEYKQKGQNDKAIAILAELLHDEKHGLAQTIIAEEGRLASLTGYFSDGSTHLQFRF